MLSSSDREILGAIGISADELVVYERLLRCDGATPAEIAAALGLGPGRVRRLLSMLEQKGLATHLPERVIRFLAAPPDIALEALIAKRQDELGRARAVAVRLREDVLENRSKRPAVERVVEVVTGQQAQARVFEQMQRSAQNEVLSVERPPYVLDLSETNPAQQQAIGRGVRYRNVIDTTALEIPGNLERIEHHIADGEEARVFGGLPLKLVIVDRRIGIIPLNIERAGDPALLVRSSSLLDALCVLFEMIWERAAPVGAAVSGATAAAAAPDRDPAHLVTLLASGLADKAIAHHLGVSTRTLDRRWWISCAASMRARASRRAGLPRCAGAIPATIAPDECPPWHGFASQSR
jgi:sugar-specific transcriptional regulator TrmB